MSTGQLTSSTTASAAASTHPLFRSVDIAWLVYFRVAFGVLMIWEVYRYFAHGWIREYWIEPTFHFTYFGFEWVRPWPGPGMYIHFVALGVLAVCLTAGLWYRAAATLFFLGFTYTFLLEQARYLNHFYLVSLLSFLMIFLPANRAFSLDARRRPAIRSATCPAWTLWLLRMQIGIVYFYGGLAKLNSDWLQGEPIRMWLARRADYAVIGPLLTQEWVVYIFTYGGLLFDLLVVPMLLWRRTRVLAFALAVAFHLTNAVIFNIGIFPWLGIAATALFFDPDWPRRLLGKLGMPSGDSVEAVRAVAREPTARRRERITLALVGTYVGVQLLLPLRHHLYPGNVSWTEEGHRFSWHMKLRDKRSRALFEVRDANIGVTWIVDPRDYLTSWQAGKMAGRPDMILQFGHAIARELERKGFDHLEVRARVETSLNGREQRSLIDPSVNLVAERRTLWPAGWIVQMSDPLPAPGRVELADDLEETDDL